MFRVLFRFFFFILGFWEYCCDWFLSLVFFGSLFVVYLEYSYFCYIFIILEVGGERDSKMKSMFFIIERVVGCVIYGEDLYL